VVGAAVVEVSGAQLLVKGDHVGLEMDGAGQISLPPDWGMVHDPLGAFCDPYDVFLLPYAIHTHSVRIRNARLVHLAAAYFGHGTPLENGSVVIPQGPWQPVGRVRQIFYRRYGNLAARYYHPFRQNAPPVMLDRCVEGQTARYVLRLPPGSILDSHGFVWP
jgi:hypothetical protein